MAKTDYLHTALKWLSYNRYTAVSTLVAGSFIGVSGCQITAKDPVSGESLNKQSLATMVERRAAESRATYATLEAEFKAKVEAMNTSDALVAAKYQAAIDSITQKEQFWKSAVEWAGSIPAVSGNPLLAGAISMGGALFGLGTLADNRRKDALLKS